MKKIIFTLLSLGFFVVASAQKVLPEIKLGTTLSAVAYVQGQQFPLVMVVKSVTAPVILSWSVDGFGEGSFEINEKGLQSGTTMFAGQPSPGSTKLGDTETYGLISKAAFKSLVDNKTFAYNGKQFKLVTPDTKPMKLSGKEIDALHVINDEKVELWILNNANFPLVLQTAGMPIDIVISDIK